MTRDLFADIAAGGMGGRSDELISPQPLPYTVDTVRLEAVEVEALETRDDIRTAEALNAELDRERKRYAPFLRVLPQAPPSDRERFPIERFWVDGVERSIPEYGGPEGYARKEYRSTFELPELEADKAAYICFRGADYRCSVSLNGQMLGQHEGFFAPFEFDITAFARVGQNDLVLVLENDFIYMGNEKPGQEAFTLPSDLTWEEVGRIEGDKLYAATDPGYDDPYSGWHHCPPGMGLYQGVYVEIRSRIHIADVFVRALPEQNAAEVWVEVENADYLPHKVEFRLSLYGQNFEACVFEDKLHVPSTRKTVGRGDSLTEASVKEAGMLGAGIPQIFKKGLNLFKIPITLESFRWWSLEQPYLYQIQVTLFSESCVRDTRVRQFGMRSFTQDVTSSPKGMFYLNGQKIRLRGANTMGFEQQDVIREDWTQLMDDILLAKICHMNFLRLTQRPVQEEVYDYCDKLGLMTQTNLPLFGCMRRTRFAEGLRQAEEMERFIRSHCCNILLSYINEPFPNAHNEPHRHLERKELENFFAACDFAVRLHNPDRVIKHVDGDYDPPCATMPDNHCYPMWYNGHGIDAGRLHKGYWLDVKPDWYYACGEYGMEGLDFAEVMREYYPQEWIKEPFDPNNICCAQTGRFHYFFYDSPDTMEDWVRKSQSYQAFATRWMSEALRRDARMVSFAIHLFIDAFPSSWMKTIMDCRRVPKPAYFAYRDALSPLMISLRTDRFSYYDDEEIRVEAYICNDPDPARLLEVQYECYGGEELVYSARCATEALPCTVTRAADCCMRMPKVENRKNYRLRALLLEAGKIVHVNELELGVFRREEEVPVAPNVQIHKLAVGEHLIAGKKIRVKACGMQPLHFVSRNSGHSLCAGFHENDFRFWYDKETDCITPLLYTTFSGEGLEPVLTSGNLDGEGHWSKALAAALFRSDDTIHVICQLELRTENPVARRFLNRLRSLC